jgi:hypothetical protein
VTQALIFMYLIFIGYMLMGVMGVVGVSLLFLIALLSPVLYQVGRTFWTKRRATSASNDLEVNQEV